MLTRLEGESVTGKYGPLYEFLVESRRLGNPHWYASFRQVEIIIGESLPTSARTWRMWWSNLLQPGRASTAWTKAGWKSTNVDMKAQTVLFRIVK